MPENAISESEQPQFYRRVVALSDSGHSDWKIKLQEDYGFSRTANAVLVTAVEFGRASHEYPIVFVESGNEVKPVAILGLKSGQNLYLNSDSGWKANYIPAYIRRYPFILAGKQADDSYTVCIDESYEGFNRKTGESLFADDGSYSPYLKKAIGFLKDYQQQGEATRLFCKNLKKLGLLTPMQADIQPVRGGKFSMEGFMVVTLEKLKSKKPLELAELVKTDQMALIYHHLESLTNFKRLTDSDGLFSI